jgi:hypothetical protein
MEIAIKSSMISTRNVYGGEKEMTMGYLVAVLGGNGSKVTRT